MQTGDIDHLLIQRAVACFASGGLIAYPTEGVWGLGCDPSNQQTVEKLVRLKGRSIEKGLILVTDKLSRLSSYIAELPTEQDLQIDNNRSVTWVLPHGGKAPEWLSGGRESIAVRISQHPVIQQLCSQADQALVSTSANPAGKVPALNAEQVQAYFGDLIDVIVPGALGGENGASEIRDFLTGKILREANS